MKASEAKALAEEGIVKSQSNIILERIKAEAEKGKFRLVWGVMHDKTKEALIQLGYSVTIDEDKDLVISWD